MSHPAGPPSTSSAVPVRHRAQAVGQVPRRELQLAKDGLTYEAVRLETCPACGVRPPHPELHKFTLRGASRLVEVVDVTSSPPMVLGAALGAAVLGLGPWWPLLFMLGPLAAISNASTARWLWSPRFRLKVALCPACAADIRRARRGTRVARVVKNLAAWCLVMLAPSMFFEGMAHLSLLGPAAGVMGVVSSLAYLVERSRRATAEAMLPALQDVTPARATVLLPPAWSQVVAALQAGTSDDGK